LPIHDLGYRAWAGRRSSGLFRFAVIASAGVRVVGRNAWVRRVLLAAWLPAVGLAVAFFAYERLLEDRRVALTGAEVRGSVLAELPDGLQDGDAVIEALTKEDLRQGRHLMWSWLLSTFLRAPQALMAMLVIGMIAPPLISRDVRTRAFLTYFSKPIGPAEYVLGKLLVVATYLTMITTAPALGCYLFGVALSSDLGVLADTWDLPLRVVLASLIFVVPAASVALMFSALTSESRFAAFAWFAFWGLGFVAWNLTYAVMSDRAYRDAYAEQGDPRQVEARLAEARQEIDAHPLAAVSLYDTLVRLQRWVFGLETRWSAVLPSLVMTVAVTFFAWLVLLRKVAALVRV